MGGYFLSILMMNLPSHTCKYADVNSEYESCNNSFSPVRQPVFFLKFSLQEYIQNQLSIPGHCGSIYLFFTFTSAITNSPNCYLNLIFSLHVSFKESYKKFVGGFYLKLESHEVFVTFFTSGLLKIIFLIKSLSKSLGKFTKFTRKS